MNKSKHDRLWDAISDLQLLRSQDANVRAFVAEKKVKLTILELDHIVGFLVERALEQLEKDGNNEKAVISQESSESVDVGSGTVDVSVSGLESEG